MQVSSNSFVYNKEDHQLLTDKKFVKGGDDNDIIKEHQGKLLSPDRTTQYKKELINYLVKDVLPNADPETKAAIMAMLKEVAASDKVDPDVKKEITALTGKPAETKTTLTTEQQQDDKRQDFLKRHKITLPTSYKNLKTEEKKEIDKLILMEKNITKKELFEQIIDRLTHDVKARRLTLVESYKINATEKAILGDVEKEKVELTLKEAKEDFEKLKNGQITWKEFETKWSKKKEVIHAMFEQIQDDYHHGKIKPDIYKRIQTSFEGLKDFFDKDVRKHAKEKGYDFSKLEGLVNTLKVIIEEIKIDITTGPKYLDQTALNQDGVIVKNDLAKDSEKQDANKVKETFGKKEFDAKMREQSVQKLLAVARKEINDIENKVIKLRAQGFKEELINKAIENEKNNLIKIQSSLKTAVTELENKYQISLKTSNKELNDFIEQKITDNNLMSNNKIKTIKGNVVSAHRQHFLRLTKAKNEKIVQNLKKAEHDAYTKYQIAALEKIDALIKSYETAENKAAVIKEIKELQKIVDLKKQIESIKQQAKHASISKNTLLLSQVLNYEKDILVAAAIMKKTEDKALEEIAADLKTIEHDLTKRVLSDYKNMTKENLYKFLSAMGMDLSEMADSLSNQKVNYKKEMFELVKGALMSGNLNPGDAKALLSKYKGDPDLPPELKIMLQVIELMEQSNPDLFEVLQLAEKMGKLPESMKNAIMSLIMKDPDNPLLTKLSGIDDPEIQSMIENAKQSQQEVSATA